VVHKRGGYFIRVSGDPDDARSYANKERESLMSRKHNYFFEKFDEELSAGKAPWDALEDAAKRYSDKYHAGAADDSRGIWGIGTLSEDIVRAGYELRIHVDSGGAVLATAYKSPAMRLEYQEDTVDLAILGLWRLGSYGVSSFTGRAKGSW
jgi:hypothetical protein